MIWDARSSVSSFLDHYPHPCLGYLAGVATAVALHVAVRSMSIWTSGFESATRFSLWTSFGHLALIDMGGLGLALLIVVPLAVIPCALVADVLLWSTRRLSTILPLTGLFVSILSAPALEAIRPKFFDNGDVPFWRTVVAFLPLLAMCGLVGGWVSSRVAVRRPNAGQQ